MKIDMIGNVYGMLTVIGEPHRLPGTDRYVCAVQCECGVIKSVDSYMVRHGITKSCGCARLKALAKNNTTHGESGQSGLYQKWCAMRRRCFCKSDSSYKRYGGRGIGICEAWSSYVVFRDWAVANGYQQGLTIERVDVNGNYEPSNVKWIPAKDQAKNRTTSRFETAFGETKAVWEWLQDTRCKLNEQQLRRRLAEGWELERALTTPVRKGKYRHETIA